jgi:hypothetical protein
VVPLAVSFCFFCVPMQIRASYIIYPPGHCQDLRKAKLPYRQLNKQPESCENGNSVAHIPNVAGTLLSFTAVISRMSLDASWFGTCEWEVLRRRRSRSSSFRRRSKGGVSTPNPKGPKKKKTKRRHIPYGDTNTHERRLYKNNNTRALRAEKNQRLDLLDRHEAVTIPAMQQRIALL